MIDKRAEEIRGLDESGAFLWNTTTTAVRLLLLLAY